MAQIEFDKLHYNTLSTIIRHLEEKSYVSYNAYVKTHQYYSIVSKEINKERIDSLNLIRYQKTTKTDSIKNGNTTIIVTEIASPLFIVSRKIVKKSDF